MIRRTICLLLLTASNALALSNGSVVIREESSEGAPLAFMSDVELGMHYGAANLYTGYQLVTKLDDYVLMLPGMHADRWYGRLLRFSKLTGLDAGFYAPLTLLVQHEIFGHGARLREFGINPRYEIDPPFLVFGGGGVTIFDDVEYFNLGAFERPAVTSGGVESTYVMSQHILERNFMADRWDYRDAVLYAILMLDQPFYTASITDDRSGTSEGHDIQVYVDEINLNCNQEALSTGRLKRFNWLNYVDTGLIAAANSAALFVADAEVSSQILMLRAGDVKLMPFLRCVLTPWGPEYGAGSWFSSGPSYGVAYLRYGETCDVDSFALGLKLRRCYQLGNWDFGFRCEAWKQPDVLSFDWIPKKHFGALLTGLASWRVADRFSAELELGGKSDGFVMGEPLGAGPVLRASIQLHGF